jgi:hypothetical protein
MFKPAADQLQGIVCPYRATAHSARSIPNVGVPIRMRLPQVLRLLPIQTLRLHLSIRMP